MDDLEVLDGGLCDPAVEVEHMRSCFFVPHRRLVVELNQIFHPSVLVSYQQAVTFLQRSGKTKSANVKTQHQTVLSFSQDTSHIEGFRFAVRWLNVLRHPSCCEDQRSPTWPLSCCHSVDERLKGLCDCHTLPSWTCCLGLFLWPRLF